VKSQIPLSYCMDFLSWAATSNITYDLLYRVCRRIGRFFSHTAKIAMNILRPIFPGHLISRYGDIEWPPRSPDLSVCDFYLWGHLKSVVYSAPSPRTTQELKLRIQEEISRIPVNLLCRVISVHDRLAECEQRDGGHLDDVIFRVEWCVVFFLCSVLCFKTTDSFISTNAKVCTSL